MPRLTPYSDNQSARHSQGGGVPAEQKLSVRFATAEEIRKWDDLVTSGPHGGTFLASASFAELKKRAGWTPRFLVFESSSFTSYALALERKIPVLGKHWHMPGTPLVPEATQIPEAIEALKKFNITHRHNLFSIKMDPEISGTNIKQAFSQAGLIKAPDLQVHASTIIVDVSEGPDKAFEKLPSQGRYRIRQARRLQEAHVERVELTEENMRTMYQMMVGMMDRKGIAIRSRKYEYFRTMWQLFHARNQGFLYFLISEGKPISGVFAIKYGKKGTYKDGASVSNKVKGGNHLLQWTIIEDLNAMGEGITSYDLFASPPSDKRDDPTHRFHTLLRFKTTFNKEITDHVGTWDLPLKQWQYTVWDKVVYPTILRIMLRGLQRYFY